MPYRDEGEALGQREASLAEELDRIDSELGHLRRLKKRRENVLRALSDVRAVQRQRRMPLSNLTAASPCEASWSSMDGDGRVRQCGRCGKRVYDVASLPRAEALTLVMEDARFSDVDEARQTLRVRADGTLIAGDCPLGAHRQRRSRAVVGGGLAALGLATLLSHPAHHGACPHHDQTELAPYGAALHPQALGPQALGPNAVDGAGAVWVELDDEIEIDTQWSRREAYEPYDMDRDDGPKSEAEEKGGEPPADDRRPPPAPGSPEDR